MESNQHKNPLEEPLIDFTNLDWWLEREWLLKRIGFTLLCLPCLLPVGLEIWTRKLDVRYSIFPFGRTEADYFGPMGTNHGPWYGPGPHDTFIACVFALFIGLMIASFVLFLRILGSTRRDGVKPAVIRWLLSLIPLTATATAFLQCASLFD